MTAQLIDPAKFRAMSPERRAAIADARRIQVARAQAEHVRRYHEPARLAARSAA